MSLSTVWSPGPNPPPTDQANHSQIPAARKPVCELIERLKQALKKTKPKKPTGKPHPQPDPASPPCARASSRTTSIADDDWGGDASARTQGLSAFSAPVFGKL